jgi:DNA-binding transcriptional regulator WhiA
VVTEETTMAKTRVRRKTVYDYHRQLIKAMQRANERDCRDVARHVRDAALAKTFFGGASLENIEKFYAMNVSRDGIESAIRRYPRMGR